MPTCDVCGGDQFSAHDGFFFCDECNTQSQEIRDMTNDEFYGDATTARGIALSDATRAKRQRNKERTAERRAARTRISQPHALNLLLKRWTGALVSRGAPQQLSEVTAQLWELVLRSGQGMLSTVWAAALLWLALADCEPLCLLSDVLRWTRQGVLPLLTANNEMPEDVTIGRAAFTTGKRLGLTKTRTRVLQLVKKLGLPPPTPPPLHRLLRRLLDELLLPAQLADVVTNVAKQAPPLDSCLPEADALALLLVTLKLLLGLDDATEWRNSEVAAARNDTLPDGPRWFDFSAWLQFMLQVRANAGEQDFLELETADRELGALPGLDVCRHRHRQLLFDYVHREGAFRKLERPATIKTTTSENAEYRQRAMRMFGRPEDPPPLPSKGDDLLRPVGSRLEREGGEALRRACEFREARVEFLLDENHVRALGAQGVEVRVVHAAARQRAPTGVKPHRSSTCEQQPFDLLLVSDTEEVGGEETRPVRRRRPPSGLCLFRPHDEIWRLPVDCAGASITVAKYQADLAPTLPVGFRCLLELLAASIDLTPTEFASRACRVEMELVGMEPRPVRAREHRSRSPESQRKRTERNKARYQKYGKTTRRANSAEIERDSDAEEAERDSDSGEQIPAAQQGSEESLSAAGPSVGARTRVKSSPTPSSSDMESE